MYKVIGLSPSKFTPPDSDKEILGVNVFVVSDFTDRQKENGAQGVSAERIYIKKTLEEELGEIKVNDQITFSYNRYGKVDSFKIHSGKAG